MPLSFFEFFFGQDNSQNQGKKFAEIKKIYSGILYVFVMRDIHPMRNGKSKISGNYFFYVNPPFPPGTAGSLN
jgi:hypothetical protein